MWSLAALLALALACGTLQAQTDYYFKEIVHADQYSWGSLQESTFLRNNELWLGQKRVTSTERGRTAIVDLTVDSMYILNPATYTYVATSIPPALPEILSDELQWKYKQEVTSARVELTNDSRVFCGRLCAKYEVTTWRESPGSRSDEREMVVWACNNLPTDCPAYREMVRCMRTILNRNEAGIAELSRIDSVQMMIEMPEGGWFSGRKLVSEILE